MIYKLQDLIKLKTQGVNTTTDKVKYVKKGFKIVQAKNIEQYRVTFDEKNFIDEKTFYRMKENHILNKGDILFTNIGSQLGNCAIYNSEEKAIITWNVMKLVPNEKILKEYMCYLLNYNSKSIKQLNSSSTMPFVSGKELMNFEMEVPNINCQAKSIKILSNINKKIELNNKINDNLQELINNLFIKFFINVKLDEYEIQETELGHIPVDWKVGVLSDIVEFYNGYGFDSKKMLDEEVDKSYKVFKMGNINIGGGINKSKTKSWMKLEDCVGLDKFIAKKGDILMCMTDMKNSGNPLLGHTALIDTDDEFVINQRVGLLRCNKGIGYAYVYTLSNLDFFIADIRSRANSGVQVNLTTKGICETKVIIPDSKSLEKFEKIANPIYESKFNILKENENLMKLRDVLLPKLMNGEIDLDKIEI